MTCLWYLDLISGEKTTCICERTAFFFFFLEMQQDFIRVQEIVINFQCWSIAQMGGGGENSFEKDKCYYLEKGGKNFLD